MNFFTNIKKAFKEHPVSTTVASAVTTAEMAGIGFAEYIYQDVMLNTEEVTGKPLQVLMVAVGLGSGIMLQLGLTYLNYALWKRFKGDARTENAVVTSTHKNPNYKTFTDTDPANTETSDKQTNAAMNKV